MSMMDLYDTTTFECSELITKHYSTSFSLGIRTLDKSLHRPIYAIYGFVRYADEIVDTFHGYNKKELLEDFKQDAYKAIKNKISLNPVLHSFQLTVNKYNIDLSLIEAFLKSMEMDLYSQDYTNDKYSEYIYGSAEVVGLMCLYVFCEGNENQYQHLKESARRLGSAFQKVNFLRDMKSDYEERGRIYFPNVEISHFTAEVKLKIEEDIAEDFREAYKGIVQLPKTAKLGVYVAYVYYLQLFKRIQKATTEMVLAERIRLPNKNKFSLLVKCYIKHQLNYIN
jgi:phytoene/squalene synthetase